MAAITPAAIIPTDAHWPERVTLRLGESAPPALCTFGPLALLATSRTALFCSARAPGDAILRAHDAARRFRDEGVTVISGFHSPLEKECLRILLRGTQPIIICLARAMARIPVLGECRAAFKTGRVLFISPFEKSPRRVTRESAVRRNEVAAALADEAFVAHVAPGGETERLAGLLREWGVPVSHE